MSQLKNMIRGGKPEVIILEQGTFTLGRDQGCDYRLEHPSVSTIHCEIRRDHGRVFVRDLGSTNGTFIEEKPLTGEIELMPGQLIRFGELPWRFEGTALHVGGAKPATSEQPEEKEPTAKPISIGINRSARAPAEAATNEGPPVQRPCDKHANKAALYICKNCRSEFCPECVRSRKGNAGTKHYCPICSGRCEDIGAFELNIAEQSVARERSRNLFLCLGEVFRYPFRASGIVLMVGGSLLMGGYQFMMAWASRVGPFGIGAIILFTFLFVGYFTAYLHKIVLASANGDQELPDWPDFSSLWDDIALPALHFIGVWLISFGPVQYYVFRHGMEANPWVWIALLLVGLIYFPMACLSVTMFNTLLAANPLTVFASMFKVLQNYYLASFIFWGAFLTSFALDVVLAMLPTNLLAVRLVLWAISVPISVYLFVIEARVLGLIYYGNSDKLGWFKEKDRLPPNVTQDQ